MAQSFKKGEFNKEEKVFLTEFLPVWFSTFYSDDQTSAKGDKKEWVIKNVYPKFIDHFFHEGAVRPTMQSLQIVSHSFISTIEE